LDTVVPINWLFELLAIYAATFLSALGMTMFMPLLADAPVSWMLRVMFAIWLTVASVPDAAATAAIDGVSLLSAFLQGVMVSAIARLVISAFQTGAAILLTQGGLNLGTLLNPTMQQPSSSLELLFYMLAVKVFAESGLLGIMLAANAPLGALTSGSISDALTLLSQAFIRSLQIALGIALPFITINIAFVLACGLANMFFKQLPVVMILQPLQISATLVVLGLYFDAAIFPLTVGAAFDGFFATASSR